MSLARFYNDVDIRSFYIVKDTNCMRQIDDYEFVNIDNCIVKSGEIYDGKMVCKRNGNYYLDLGFDMELEYNVFVPIVVTKDDINIRGT